MFRSMLITFSTTRLGGCFTLAMSVAEMLAGQHLLQIKLVLNMIDQKLTMRLDISQTSSVSNVFVGVWISPGYAHTCEYTNNLGNIHLRVTTTNYKTKYT